MVCTMSEHLPSGVATVPEAICAYEFSDDPDRIDRDSVWRFMVEDADWGKWRTREVVDTQLDRSWRMVGVYERATGTMVGFARAVSDGISMAYLADVYIVVEHRGKGLGLALVRAMIDEGPGAHFRWMLHTYSAHGLYAKAGFVSPDTTFLERRGGAPTPGRNGSVSSAANGEDPALVRALG
jgi:GNAT superfamily N-acetyltransferase